jgi:hypothetical protein
MPSAAFIFKYLYEAATTLPAAHLTRLLIIKLSPGPHLKSCTLLSFYQLSILNLTYLSLLGHDKTSNKISCLIPSIWITIVNNEPQWYRILFPVSRSVSQRSSII